MYDIEDWLPSHHRQGRDFNRTYNGIRPLTMIADCCRGSSTAV
jgi:hypothetical protein